jgi:hypothetical protein
MADTADTAAIMANMPNTANILARCEVDTRSAEAGRNSAAANRENTVTGAVETGAVETGAVETGVAGIGAAIGGVAVTGAAAADSSLSAEVIRIIGIGTHIGAGAILTRTTAIILRIGTLTTVAPYQDSDSLGPDPSLFPAPASPGNCASGIPALKSHYGSLNSPACSCVSITPPASS